MKLRKLRYRSVVNVAMAVVFVMTSSVSMAEEPNVLNAFDYIETFSPGNVNMLQATVSHIEKSSNVSDPLFLQSPAGIKYQEAKKVITASEGLGSCLIKSTSSSEKLIQSFFDFSQRPKSADNQNSANFSIQSANAQNGEETLRLLQEQLRAKGLATALGALVRYSHKVQNATVDAAALSEAICSPKGILSKIPTKINPISFHCTPEMEGYLVPALQGQLDLLQNSGSEGFQSVEKVWKSVNTKIALLNEKLERLDKKDRELRSETIKLEESRISQWKSTRAANNKRKQLHQEYMLEFVSLASGPEGSLLLMSSIQKEIGHLRRPFSGWLFHRKDVAKNSEGDYFYKPHSEVSLQSVERAIADGFENLRAEVRKYLGMGSYVVGHEENLGYSVLAHPTVVGEFLLTNPEAAVHLCPVVKTILDNERLEKIIDWSIFGVTMAVFIASWLIPGIGPMLGTYLLVSSLAWEANQAFLVNRNTHKKLIRSMMVEESSKSAQKIVDLEKDTERRIVIMVIEVGTYGLLRVKLAKHAKYVKDLKEMTRAQKAMFNMLPVTK